MLAALVLLSAWIGVGLTPSVGYTASEAVAVPINTAVDSQSAPIRLEDQPFYADLEIWRRRWDSGFLGQVVDTNPPIQPDQVLFSNGPSWATGPQCCR